MDEQSAILSSSDRCDSSTAEQQQAYPETSDNLFFIGPLLVIRYLLL